MVKSCLGNVGVFPILELIRQQASQKSCSCQALLENILSPFDNAVIQRKRLSEVFGFDYQIECYVPPAKRQYGYFSFPLLWGSEFVGRMDAKIDRKTHIFHIQNLHLETVKLNEFIEVLKPLLKAFMHFNRGKEIQLHNVTCNQHIDVNKEADIKQRLQGW